MRTQIPEERRYRIYRLNEKGQPDLVVETDKRGVGGALDLMAEEEEITQDDRVGILYREYEDEPGTWLVNPWAVGRGRLATTPAED